MNLETFKSAVTAALPIGETEAIVNRTDWAEVYTAVNKSVLGTLRIAFWCLPDDIEWVIQKLYESGKVDMEGRGETLEQALEDFNHRLTKRDREWTERQGYTGDFYF